MLITRETDYALRILRALSDGSQKTVGRIAAEQLIPQQFAYKIMKKLSKAGLVSVSRGTEGGCRLSADLKEVSLYHLMEAMEEGTQIIACMQDGYECPWKEKNSLCRIHGRLALVQRRLDKELKGHSLHNLIFGT